MTDWLKIYHFESYLTVAIFNPKTICIRFSYSIIKRLEEYDEFFPAFQSLVSQLYDLLGE